MQMGIRAKVKTQPPDPAANTPPKVFLNFGSADDALLALDCLVACALENGRVAKGVFLPL